ncbi:MAG: putative membrane protein [Bacteroidia bacterium]|jgi:uncharacterized membrane protein
MHNYFKVLTGKDASFNGLIIVFVMAIALNVIHALLSFNIHLAFMILNLIIACIPLIISSLISKTKNKTVSLFWMGIWLLFIPNASYLITDLVHIKQIKPDLFWLDFAMLFSYAMAGILITHRSIIQMSEFIKSRVHVQFVLPFQIVIFPLIAFGIYLGRIVRLNSWDVILHPFRTLKPEFDSYFEFRTLVNSEFRVKIAKTGRALSSNFYDENRFSQV